MDLFCQMMRLLGCKKIHTTSYHSEVNGCNLKTALHAILRWIKLVGTSALGPFKTLYCCKSWNELFIDGDVVCYNSSPHRTIFFQTSSKIICEQIYSYNCQLITLQVGVIKMFIHLKFWCYSEMWEKFKSPYAQYSYKYYIKQREIYLLKCFLVKGIPMNYFTIWCCLWGTEM